MRRFSARYPTASHGIVKLFFREHKQKGELEILTKKPLRAGDAEIAANSRAGSAKLRVANRIK